MYKKWNKQSMVRKKGKEEYIPAIVLLCIVFALFGYFVINSINTFQYNRIIENANKQSIIYGARLANNIDSNKVIDKLVEEKLLTACRMVRSYKYDLSNESLSKLAQDLNVDEIYWYSAEGEIIYTANDYLGWRVKEGDSVYNFMTSGLDRFVEPIRHDIDSQTDLKYAFFKTEKGQFIQIGIYANNIYKLIDNTCPHILLEELAEESDILKIYYLQESDSRVFCDKEYMFNNYSPDPYERKAIISDESYYAKKIIGGQEGYETLMPIFINDKKVGTLIIFYSLEDANILLKKISLIVIFILLIIYLTYSVLIGNLWRQKQEISKVAYFDPVSRLYNKLYFKNFLETKIKKGIKNKTAILLIGCSNFNLIKLTYGQEILEELVLRKANILKSIGFKEEALYHYEEDVFCIYVEYYRDMDDIRERLDRILSVFEREMRDTEYSNLMVIKVGILELAEDSRSINSIYNQIDILIAKMQENKKRVYLFDKGIKDGLLENEAIEKELRREAVEDFKGFYMQYQPLLDLQTEKIVGLEALARWENKTLGHIAPDKFIKIAEDIQLIIPLGDWIIRKVCRFIKELEKKEVGDIRVAVNISIIQLLQDNFTDKLLRILKEEGVDAGSLELEITESSFAENIDLINGKLVGLREKGISISLDDFGTGYSSLARLSSLEINTLKIDKSFVDNINNTEQGNIFIKNIILLAKELGYKVVAEGVENQNQKKYLKNHQCDMMQGYLFSKPVLAGEAINLIVNTNYKKGGNTDERY